VVDALLDWFAQNGENVALDEVIDSRREILKQYNIWQAFHVMVAH
jgi:hypothetical protein